MPSLITVAAPSRLHFGLFAFGATGRQFGGVGAMVEQPGIELVTTPAGQFTACGPLCERVQVFTEQWSRFYRLTELPACRIEVTRSSDEHIGLGTGTQLGLAVAAALCRFHDRPLPAAGELAASVGRGLRSAVGTYGFLAGGLIVERGKLPSEILSPLDAHLALPADWRFVLLRPVAVATVSGEDERRAFARLPPVAPEVTQQLCEEVREHLVPAAAREEFELFGESLYRFGRLAGSCFAERQGGPYNGPVLTALVDRVRSLGVRGVGQSSWGPTLFAMLPDQTSAEDLVRSLADQSSAERLEIVISRPCNSGARVVCSE